MKNSTETKRRASSYRLEAREVLKGRWGAALATCLLLVILPILPCALLALIPSMVPAELVQQLAATTVSMASQQAVDPNQLNALLNNALAVLMPILGVVGGAALLSLILQPFCLLGRAKMAVGLYGGDKVGFHVLGIGWKGFWKTIGLQILTCLAVNWPMWLVSILSSVATTWAQTQSIVSVMQGVEPNQLLQLIPVISSIVTVIMACITVVRSFRYVPAIYLLAMHPAGPIGKIMRRSRRMMRGKKWRVFCLSLSFIGWNLLAVLFTAAVVAVLAYIPAIASMVWPAPVAGVVLAVVTTLPLTAYLEVSMVAFIHDIGNRRKAVEE